MKRRASMCQACPWNTDRTGAPIDADTWATVEARLAAGEEWVCHLTCDGPAVTVRSRLCAGAPT